MRLIIFTVLLHVHASLAAPEPLVRAQGEGWWSSWGGGAPEPDVATKDSPTPPDVAPGGGLEVAPDMHDMTEVETGPAKEDVKQAALDVKRESSELVEVLESTSEIQLRLSAWQKELEAKEALMAAWEAKLNLREAALAKGCADVANAAEGAQIVEAGVQIVEADGATASSPPTQNVGTSILSMKGEKLLGSLDNVQVQVQSAAGKAADTLRVILECMGGSCPPTPIQSHPDPNKDPLQAHHFTSQEAHDIESLQ